MLPRLQIISRSCRTAILSLRVVCILCSPQETKDNELRYVAATEVAILRKLTSCRFILTMMEYYEVHIDIYNHVMYIYYLIICHEGINESCIITEHLAGSDLFNTIAHRSFELSEDKCKIIRESFHRDSQLLVDDIYESTNYTFTYV